MIIPKFRAWHKELKLMERVRKLDLVYGLVFVVMDSSRHQKTASNITHWGFYNIELMQWTGLKDKDRKDIYEGDILIYEFGGGIDTYIIERNPDDEQLHARYLYAPGYNTDYLAEAHISTSKVVGNYFENPELLHDKS